MNCWTHEGIQRITSITLENTIHVYITLYIQEFLEGTVKPTCKAATQKGQKLVLKANYCLMQVKSIAECSKHSAILLTFIRLPFAIKTLVLSILSDGFIQVLL